jgi:hypothetical protein
MHTRADNNNNKSVLKIQISKQIDIFKYDKIVPWEILPWNEFVPWEILPWNVFIFIII